VRDARKGEKEQWLLTEQLPVPHSYHDADLYFHPDLTLSPLMERKDYAELLFSVSSTVAITVAKQGKAAFQKKQGRAPVTANTTKQLVFLDVNAFPLFFIVTLKPMK